MQSNVYAKMHAVAQGRRPEPSGSNITPKGAVLTSEPGDDRSSSASEGYYSGRESTGTSEDSIVKPYTIVEDAYGYIVSTHEDTIPEDETQQTASRTNSTELKLPIKQDKKKDKKKKERTHSDNSESSKTDKKQKHRVFKKFISFQGKEKSDEAGVYEDMNQIEKEISKQTPVETGGAVKQENDVNQNNKGVQSSEVAMIQQESRQRKHSCPDPSRWRLPLDLPVDLPPPPPCKSKIPPKPGYVNVPPDSLRPIVAIDDIPSDLSRLSVHQVSDCLRLLKLHKHVDRFVDEDIDGSLLVYYTFDEFMDLGMNNAESRKLECFVRKGWRPNITTTTVPGADGRGLTGTGQSEESSLD